MAIENPAPRRNYTHKLQELYTTKQGHTDSRGAKRYGIVLLLEPLATTLTVRHRCSCWLLGKNASRLRREFTKDLGAITRPIA